MVAIRTHGVYDNILPFDMNHRPELMAADTLALRYPNVRLLREAARARLPQADLRFRGRRRRRRSDSAPQRECVSALELPAATAGRRGDARSIGGALRPQRWRRPCSSGRRDWRASFGRAARSRRRVQRPAPSTVYCQSHGSVCSIEELAAHTDGTALDAGLHLSRPRLHARVDAARPRRRLSRAGADDRQSAARQARARPRQRILDPAAIFGGPVAGHGDEVAVGMVDAPRVAHADLRQLCSARRDRIAGNAGRAHGLAARSRDELGRRRASCARNGMVRCC